MAQIRAYVNTPGDTTKWQPLAAVKVGDEYILKTVNTAPVKVPKHYNGTAGTASVPVAFAGITASVFIDNLDPINLLEVSFDGGTDYYVIGAGKSLKLDVAISGIDIKASANGTPYQIITTE